MEDLENENDDPVVGVGGCSQGTLKLRMEGSWAGRGEEANR